MDSRLRGNDGSWTYFFIYFFILQKAQEESTIA